SCSCLMLLLTTTSTALPTHSLHDALPICRCIEHLPDDSPRTGPSTPGSGHHPGVRHHGWPVRRTAFWSAASAPGSPARHSGAEGDRKSTRLNSSHVKISYAVFCLKKYTYL